MEEQGTIAPYEYLDGSPFSFDVDFFRERSREKTATLATRTTSRQINCGKVPQTDSKFPSPIFFDRLPQPASEYLGNTEDSSLEPIPFSNSRYFVPVAADEKAVKAARQSSTKHDRTSCASRPYASRVFDRRALEEDNIAIPKMHHTIRKGPAQPQRNGNNSGDARKLYFCEPISRDSGFIGSQASVVSHSSSCSKRLYEEQEMQDRYHDYDHHHCPRRRRRLRYEPPLDDDGESFVELPFPKELERYYQQRVHDFAVAERARLPLLLRMQAHHPPLNRSCFFELKLLDEEAELLGKEIAKGTYEFPNE